jgi:methylated-DNA-[protein]-cysteine S-methyltransferase
MTQKPVFHYTAYSSPLGQLYLLAEGDNLLAVGMGESLEAFKKRALRRTPGNWEKVNPASSPVLTRAVKALDAFFKENKRLELDVQFETGGTPFQQKVWKQLRRIPSGETLTYGQVAEKIGSPGAARAVGSACGANPIPLFIPCHRVIGSDGNLCGFGGGGIDVKKWLLDYGPRL